MRLHQTLRSFRACFSKKRPGRRPGGTATKSARWPALRLELLEDRTLLSFSLTGDPIWVSQGPEPIFNGNNVQGIPNAPQIGAVNQVAIDPSNPDHMFAATASGGVWVTGSGTADNPTWVAETDRMPSLSIGSVAISPLDSNTVFAGTALLSADGGPAARVGIYRSTTNGNFWIQLGQSTFGGQDIRQIIPTSQGGTLATQVVLVLATNGVYRSSDGGVTWGSGPVLAGNVTDLQADPGNSLRIY